MSENKRAFKIKWSKHEEHVCDTWSKALGSEEFYDVTLACEGGTIEANKVVLAMCSPFFREMLQGNDCSRPYLPIRGITVKTMKNVLEYLHTGQVILGRDDFADFDTALECLKTDASIDIISPCQSIISSDESHSDMMSHSLIQRQVGIECTTLGIGSCRRQNIRKDIVPQPEKLEDVAVKIETPLNVHKTAFYEFMHQNSFMDENQ